jgi:phenylalanyl-tRNA synthetase alpha chain
LILIKYPEKIPEQDALEAIAKGESISEDLAKVLLFRKLIEKIKVNLEKLKELEGKEITNLTPELIKTGFWRKVKFKPYNIEVVGKKIYGGKRHPYVQFLNEVRKKLVELGFKEMTGPIIETEFWNYDSLFQPQDHPARDWFSTFRLKYPKYGSLPKGIAKKVKMAHEVGVAGSIGWRYKWDPRKAMQLMPRGHGTCLSARTLASKPEIPGKYFAIARCYRPDVIDPTHMIEFNQVEGIVIDENLNFKHLLGILKMFAIEICKAKKVKFSPDYYPFVEPGVQLSAKHPKLGWMEFGGAGIFREELTEPLNIYVPVIAWGLGIDRLAMFRLGINDIRELFSKNLDWLRKKVVHEYIF